MSINYVSSGRQSFDDLCRVQASNTVTAPAMKKYFSALFVLLPIAAAFFALAPASAAQTDWIRTGTGLGVERVRIAVPDFKTPSTSNFSQVFDQTLFNDLKNAGIFDVVSKSLYPLAVPGSPAEIKLDAWNAEPVNASMVAFGSLSSGGDNSSGTLTVQGWLFDARNSQSPQVLGKQYSEPASEESARLIAHRFADEIISRLGGGIAGIAESKIYFVRAGGRNKEIWQMDYDGANQKQITRLGSISLSPRVSPDGSRLAFTTFARGGPDIAMYSLELGRMLSFPRFGGANLSAAWTRDGSKIAFSSSMRGDTEIYVVDSSGSNPRRLTTSRGPDVSPVWNPKTDAQIAWVSGRNGLPEIFLMDADGAGVQRLTEAGYAVSPSWSPNGQFLAFSWNRKYGPGAPGGQDIYVMDVATRRFIQLTHGSGTNDFPSWSPDGRHLVFQSTHGGVDHIWSMLADGTQLHQLTMSGRNSQPNWSFK